MAKILKTALLVLLFSVVGVAQKSTEKAGENSVKRLNTDKDLPQTKAWGAIDFYTNLQQVNVVPVGTGLIERHTIVELRVELPANAQILDIRGEAKNWSDPDSAYALCPRGGGCPIGWCMFDGDPQETLEAGLREVRWKFENWSHDLGRWARMTVTYAVPPSMAIKSKSQ